MYKMRDFDASRSYLKDISVMLKDFGNGELQAPNQLIIEGKRLSNGVFQKLKSQSHFSLEALHFGGSLGKETSIIFPDVDLLVAVRNCLPPTQVLEDFYQILKLNHASLSIEKFSIQQNNRFSIQFAFKCGIQVNLVPVTNLPAKKIHRLIAQHPQNHCLYGSSFFRKQLDFSKFNSEWYYFLIIRLTKLWYKSLSFGLEHLSNGSHIMELIAITAAYENNLIAPYIGFPTLAMQRVFSMICNLKTLKLVFRRTSPANCWKRVINNEINSPDLIPDVIGTKEILQKNFFIVDPSNPFNDLLAGNSPAVIDKLIEFAKVTKGKLDQFIEMGPGYYRHSIKASIIYLFSAQPISLLKEFHNYCPKYFFVRCKQTEPAESTKFKLLTIRNEYPLHYQQVLVLIDRMKWRLATLITCLVKLDQNRLCNVANKEEDLGDIEAHVRHLISENFTGILEEETEHNMDITMNIPFSFNEESFEMKVGFLWQLNSVCSMARETHFCTLV